MEISTQIHVDSLWSAILFILWFCNLNGVCSYAKDFLVMILMRLLFTYSVLIILFYSRCGRKFLLTFLPSSLFLRVASYLNYGWLKQNVKDESLVQQRSMFIATSAIGEGIFCS